MSAAPDWKAAAEAHKRAMPVQRLVGNGMDLADAGELYRLVDLGRPWDAVAEELGERDLARADAALAEGHTATARGWYLFASACFRVGQVPLADTEPRKRELYRKLIAAFGAAGALAVPVAEHLDVDTPAGVVSGWLLRPAGVRNPPAVVIVGGFDGWREEYHLGATYLLDRGIAAFLADGPGQGESRLFHGSRMTPDVAGAFGTVAESLRADGRLGDRVGIWGNSMGGFLAALAASADEAFAACCVNGGTVRPAEVLDRYPRFVEKVRPLLGIDDPERARAAMRRYRLTPERLARLRAPLLVLHGRPDRVFLIENARALYDAAGSSDKRWAEWPDGDHCVYNHSYEKHVLVADWFADRLSASTAHAPPPRPVASSNRVPKR
ncbi:MULTISPECIES: alpha/beta hydrolase family protein [Actinomadura]|uniref:Alpha/beta hydrolase family protein n=1 Tax=Actinomadura yumaensis TaxID=111807 RepID=A0ABW2CL60_9ACTN|nr:alpha/beta hydrolase [Actinomadura sp. J1-007]MWK37095.1 prolyl oligopeptidase family serine peptidase [Actinomadura sp. J1-007]